MGSGGICRCPFCIRSQLTGSKAVNHYPRTGQFVRVWRHALGGRYAFDALPPQRLHQSKICRACVDRESCVARSTGGMNALVVASPCTRNCLKLTWG
jgi:hypothetical protein